MSLPHALLTALIERPSSGLELAGRFDRSIGYFWQATHQQIYRELARLEADGLIEATPIEGARGRKREYRVLSAGRRELQRWVTADQVPFSIRDELLVRLRAEAVVGPSAGLVSEMEDLAAYHRNKLATYRQIEAKNFSDTKMSRAQSLRHLVLQAGMEFEAQRVALCEKTLALLRIHGAEKSPPAP